MQPLVGLIMGSASDWETLQHAAPQGYRSRIFREEIDSGTFGFLVGFLLDVDSYSICLCVFQDAFPSRI